MAVSDTASIARPQPVLLADYAPPAYLVDQIALRFELDPASTRVTATQDIRRNGVGSAPLRLDGQGLTLERIAIDGEALPASAYRVDGEHLTILDPPSSFTLEIVNRIEPAANTKLMGLYVSNGIFCTQCEAEGFRRITWAMDRPDVMARYHVRIEADAAACPVLLANGNPVGTGSLEAGRHWAEWDDPFRKPAYLFALVAGDLAHIEDHFTTRSGRRVTLRLYTEQAVIGQCRWALESLQRAMRWDEERYGFEYDLDLFMIVGVSDFNFGAMENKGLNIFNTSALLARADTATDVDFQQVERIVAHEYFHNWTGDRITCRDWFQLTLKEGLTVFRDQQFAADMHSAAVKRISDVVLLRETQFAEDGGPLAHPIRPDSYVEINNFYTRTVYEKGAEVIRMLHTTLGEVDYRKGIDLYVERHDGQAVTCEDFLAAMADASGRDLDPFLRWYGQAGTPEVTVTRSFDAATGQLTLELEQSMPATPGQPDKLPVPIPLRLGLIGSDGAALPVQLAGENEVLGTERVLTLEEAKASFTFIGLEEEPVPSLLRGFSAPVRLRAGLNRDELAHLLRHDSDPFNRWEAGQTLALELLLEEVRRAHEGGSVTLDPALICSFAAMIDDAAGDPAFAARALSLPGRSYLAQAMPRILVDPMDAAFRAFHAGLGKALAPQWRGIYDAMHRPGDSEIGTEAFARRALANLALAYLVWGEVEGADGLAERQYRNAGGMTDRLGALRAIAERDIPMRQTLLEDFYAAWRHEPLVLNKWFALQAGIEDEAAPERVADLLKHKDFTLANPNRVRAVLGTFAAGNLKGFHRPDGAGYRLVADQILTIDRLNPHVSARLLTAFGRWRRFDDARQALMRGELERVAAAPGLSRDAFEIATKSLG